MLACFSASPLPAAVASVAPLRFHSSLGSAEHMGGAHPTLGQTLALLSVAVIVSDLMNRVRHIGVQLWLKAPLL